MPPPRVFCLIPNHRKSPKTTLALPVKGEHKDGVPLLFSFVGDVSSNMNDDNYNIVQDCVLDIFNNILMNDDKMELITFGNEAKKAMMLRKKRNIDPENIQDLLTPTGQRSALFDAIGLTLEQLEKDEKYCHYQREMLVLTGGIDNNSTSKYRDLVNLKAAIRKPDVAHFHLTIISFGLPAEDKEIIEALCEGIYHVTYFNCKNNEADIKATFHKACEIMERNRGVLHRKFLRNEREASAQDDMARTGSLNHHHHNKIPASPSVDEIEGNSLASALGLVVHSLIPGGKAPSLLPGKKSTALTLPSEQQQQQQPLRRQYSSPTLANAAEFLP